MFASNPKYKCCIAIRFVYHGQKEMIHFPIIIDQKTKETYNIIATNCEVHRYQAYTNFQQLTFEIILQRAITVIREKHLNREIKYLTIPKNTQVIQIFNASKKTPTFGQPFQKQDFLSAIFVGQKTVEINNVVVEQLQEEQTSIQIYLRWPVQTVRISFLSYYVSNISVFDIHSSIRVITKQFKNIILKKLNFDQQIFHSIVYSPQNTVIDESLKFYQYRDKFKKIKDDSTQWNLILKNKETKNQRELKLFLEKNGVDVEKLLCPISQQIMLNPRYVKKCKHYFEDIYIVLALQLHKKCPLCKVEAEPKHSIVDQVAKHTMKCLVQQCKVQIRLNQLTVMANIHKQSQKKKKKERINQQTNESECKSVNGILQQIEMDFQ